MILYIERARRDKHGQHFKVVIMDDDRNELGTEEFTFGLEVTLSTIRSEFMSLFHNKYESPTETVLPLEGQEIVI